MSTQVAYWNVDDYRAAPPYAYKDGTPVGINEKALDALIPTAMQDWDAEFERQTGKNAHMLLYGWQPIKIEALWRNTQEAVKTMLAPTE